MASKGQRAYLAEQAAIKAGAQAETLKSIEAAFKTWEKAKDAATKAKAKGEVLSAIRTSKLVDSNDKAIRARVTVIRDTVMR